MGDLLPKGMEFLLHSVRWLIELPLKCHAGSVVFGEVFQQLASGHMRLQFFSNQIVQEFPDLALLRERSLGEALIHTSRQPQYHLYCRTRIAHWVLHDDVRILSPRPIKNPATEEGFNST